jgi:CHAT domain-containing protein
MAQTKFLDFFFQLKYKRIILFIILLSISSIKVFTQTKLNAYDDLIVSKNFTELSTRYQNEPINNLSYLQYLRIKASEYSNKGKPTIAVEIINVCCEIDAETRSNCDTVKLNNLHLLARYYSFSNESYLSLKTNQICLSQRITCPNISPIDIAKSYNNIGIEYLNLHKFDSSFVNLNEAMKYLHFGNYKTSTLTPVVYNNYILNCIFLNEVETGLKVLKSWCKISKTNVQKERILTETGRYIYELLSKKEIKSAFKVKKIRERIIAELYGRNSAEIIQNEMRFAGQLGNQKFDEIALELISKIDNKKLSKLNQYDRFVFGNNIAVGYMNLDYDSLALNKYLELKNNYLYKFQDSSSAMLLLSNLAICYNHLENNILMRETRDLFYVFLNEKKYTDEFKDLYKKNLLMDLTYFFITEDHLNHEKTLLKLINYFTFYNDYHNLIHYSLQLSNLYLFAKSELDKAKQIITQVESYLDSSSDPDKSLAYYNYYLGEYYRRNGVVDVQNKFYKNAVNLFEKINFYPVEYENALQRYARILIDRGIISEGLDYLNKYLYINIDDTTSLDFLEKKIYFISDRARSQTNELYNLLTMDLLSQISEIHGSENRVFRKAVKVLNMYILDPKVKLEYIQKWNNAVKSKNEFEYFEAKIALAEQYFEIGNISECDKIWEGILKESEFQSIQNKKEVSLRYVGYLLSHKNVDYNFVLKILENTGIRNDDFQDFNCKLYFKIYLGTKDLKNAMLYLRDKEYFTMCNFEPDSDAHFELMKDFIDYYELIGNSNLEKIYREKQIEWLYKFQPYNREKLVSSIVSYSSLLNILDLSEFGLLQIQKVKNQFGISIDSSLNLYDLSLFIFEVVSYYNLILKKGKVEHLNYVKPLAILLSQKLQILKNQTYSQEDNLLINWLLVLLQTYLSNWDENSSNTMASNLLTLLNEFEIASGKKSLDFNNSYFEIRNKLNKGEVEVAKKEALLSEDFEILEEIYYKNGQLDSAFYFRFQQEKSDIRNLLNSSVSLLDEEIEKKREAQKASLNFAIGRYLIEKSHNSEITNKMIFELMINNNGLISLMNQDLFKFYRSSDTITKRQFKAYSNGSFENSAGVNDFQINIKLAERDPLPFQWITLQDIQSSLDDSSIFVINYKYQYNYILSNKGELDTTALKENYYLSYIIRSNGSPTLILDSSLSKRDVDLVEYYLTSINKKNLYNENSYVYDNIWKNIDKKILPTVKTVYFLPDGIYNSINVSTLFDGNRKQYIKDKYEIVLKKGSNLFLNSEMNVSNSVNNAVLLGYPNYLLTNAKSTNSENRNSSNIKENYGSSRGGGVTKNLPGTKLEVEAIKNILSNNLINTSVLKGAEASEASIKKLDSPDILHLATHGFFIENKSNNPMLNSGLLLAGCDNRTNSEEDGYLSAYETSFLNLENTKLVVLSACETGRGLMKDGDGIFGLKQGCLNAGAENIIMSLWKVDDKVTQEFMSLFYEIWLNEKTTIRQAFSKTQLEIKAKYPEPYYWGAFILVGE